MELPLQVAADTLAVVRHAITTITTLEQYEEVWTVHGVATAAVERCRLWIEVRMTRGLEGQQAVAVLDNFLAILNSQMAVLQELGKRCLTVMTPEQGRQPLQLVIHWQGVMTQWIAGYQSLRDWLTTRPTIDVPAFAPRGPWTDLDNILKALSN